MVPMLYVYYSVASLAIFGRAQISIIRPARDLPLSRRVGRHPPALAVGIAVLAARIITVILYRPGPRLVQPLFALAAHAPSVE
jgi:hypothetical protein